MPTVEKIVIAAERGLSANYNTRKVAYSVTLGLAEGEKAGPVIEQYTQALQTAVDQALGDSTSPASFTVTRQPAVRSTECQPNHT